MLTAVQIRDELEAQIAAAKRRKIVCPACGKALRFVSSASIASAVVEILAVQGLKRRDRPTKIAQIERIAGAVMRARLRSWAFAGDIVDAQHGVTAKLVAHRHVAPRMPTAPDCARVQP